MIIGKMRHWSCTMRLTSLVLVFLVSRAAGRYRVRLLLYALCLKKLTNLACYNFDFAEALKLDEVG